VGVAVLQRLADHLAQTLHLGLRRPVKRRQGQRRPQGVHTDVIGHVAPVDPPDILPPADDLADEPLGAGKRGAAPPVRLGGGLHRLAGVEQFQVHRRGEPRVVEPGLAGPQGVLIGPEEKKTVFDKVPQGLAGLPRGDGPVKVPQAPRVSGKALLHQFHDLAGDRVGQEGHRCGDLARPFLREGPAVVGVVIPPAALGFLPRHQETRFAPHPAVEKLHPELLFAPGETVEILMGGQEVPVLTDLEVGPGLFRSGPDVLAHPPLARLDDDELARLEDPAGSPEFEREGAAVFRVFESAVVHSHPLGCQGLAEVAHGGEEKDDPGLVGRHIIGLACRLGHPDGILPRIEAVEGRRAPVELVTQNEHEVADRPRGPALSGGRSSFHGSPFASTQPRTRACRRTGVRRGPCRGRARGSAAPAPPRIG